LHSKVEHIFVLIHRPLWEFDENNRNEEIDPLLVNHKAKLVLAGHNHPYKAPVVKDGVKYRHWGGGSVPMGSIEEDEWIFRHWVYTTARADGVDWPVIRPEGLFSERGKPLPSWIDQQAYIEMERSGFPIRRT